VPLVSANFALKFLQDFGSDTEPHQINYYLAEASLLGTGHQVVMILVTPVLLTLLGTFLVPYVLVISIGNILRLPKADLTLERKSQKYWLFTFSSASKLTLNQLLQLPR